jgi:hypothetical protein
MMLNFVPNQYNPSKQSYYHPNQDCYSQTQIGDYLALLAERPSADNPGKY